MDAYQASLIEDNLADEIRHYVGEIRIFDNIPSTNQYLLDHCSALVKGAVCLAASQSSGRGRRGKTWQSPAGGLYLSLLWIMPTLEKLTLIPLAVGISICRCLQGYGIEAKVKWPNDIWAQQKKIAGILVESKIKKDHVSVVIGIGLNIQADTSLAYTVDKPWISMDSLGVKSVEKNTFVACVLNQLIIELLALENAPIQNFLDHWIHYDLINQAQINIKGEHLNETGIARGITADGRLRVEIEDRIVEYTAAEVSLCL